MSDDIAKRIADLEDRIAHIQGEARVCVQELLQRIPAVTT